MMDFLLFQIDRGFVLIFEFGGYVGDILIFVEEAAVVVLVFDEIDVLFGEEGS